MAVLRGLLLGVALASLSTPSEGILCYSCQMSGGAVDLTCLNQVATQQVISCSTARYCVTKRMDYAEDQTLYSFYRSCSPANGEAPLFLNATIKDAHYHTHYTACSYDRCNKSNGKWEGGQAGGSGKPGIGVPGLGHGGGGGLRPDGWAIGAIAGAGAVAAWRARAP